MSETVWFEQVDEALLTLIKSIVQLPNSEGVLTPVYTQVRKPDEDFKIETYPAVSIYNLYSSLDKMRLDDRYVQVSRDTENAVAVYERTAIPYNLFYQIDFWSRYQSDMNEMTRKWIGHTGRDFNLPVKDMSGNDRSSFVLLTDDLVKSDFITGSDRTFHSAMTYRIYVEVDEQIRKNVPIVISPDNVVHITN